MRAQKHFSLSVSHAAAGAIHRRDSAWCGCRAQLSESALQTGSQTRVERHLSLPWDCCKVHTSCSEQVLLTSLALALRRASSVLSSRGDTTVWTDQARLRHPEFHRLLERIVGFTGPHRAGALLSCTVSVARIATAISNAPPSPLPCPAFCGHDILVITNRRGSDHLWHGDQGQTGPTQWTRCLPSSGQSRRPPNVPASSLAAQPPAKLTMSRAVASPTHGRPGRRVGLLLCSRPALHYVDRFLHPICLTLFLRNLANPGRNLSGAC